MRSPDERRRRDVIGRPQEKEPSAERGRAGDGAPADGVERPSAGADRGRTRSLLVTHRRRTGAGLAFSAALHAAALALANLSLAGLDSTVPEPWRFRAIELPPRVSIPDPPEPITRPESPEAPGVRVEDPVSLAPVAAPREGLVSLPEPPLRAREEPVPSYAAREVAPLLANRKEFVRDVRRHYPASLRRAGVEGTVELHLYVDAEGAVLRTDVTESSGVARLDRAAEELATRLRFHPALGRDRNVGVWVRQRICFVLLERSRPPPDGGECEKMVSARGR